MRAVARALEVDEPRGLIKAVVDAHSGLILGCAVLGLSGGEIIAPLQVAMLGQTPYTALRDGIFTHPSLAEALNTLFSNLDGATRRTPDGTGKKYSPAAARSGPEPLD
jgi:pyruvate/2-oxoglutarate dehydrogenase complex dihydrolipoamide dehydrogenase (E3) component